MAFEGPVPVINEIRVQEPMADLVGAGESTIVRLKLLCDHDAMSLPIDESCSLDRHGLRRHWRGWGYRLRFLKANVQTLLGDSADVKWKDVARAGG